MKATEQELTDMANALCDRYGYTERVEVRYNPRLRCIGRCDYTHLIEVSTKWVIANDKRFLVRLLKHEIAHLHFHSHSKAFALECRRMHIQDGEHLGEKRCIDP